MPLRLQGKIMRTLLFVSLLALASPQIVQAQSSGHNLQICNGYFALCAAATCKETSKRITVNVTSGGTATFPQLDCTCPLFYGPSIADVAGGNMKGSCSPPVSDQFGIWSLYSPRTEIPQEISNWAQSGPAAAASPQICPKSSALETQSPIALASPATQRDLLTVSRWPRVTARWGNHSKGRQSRRRRRL